MKNIFLMICVIYFISFLLPIYSLEIDDIEDLEDDFDDIDEIEKIINIKQINFVKTLLLFGFHIPDEEFNEGYNFSFKIGNPINKYAFFSFCFNLDRFYDINESRRRYTFDDISMGIGMFFNFLILQKNTTYIGIELGSYHSKNTHKGLDPKYKGNNLLIAWIVGHSYAINDKVSLEGTIQLKANHLRNLSINLGVGYKITE